MTKLYPEVLQISHDNFSAATQPSYEIVEEDGITYVRSDKVPVPSFSGWLVAMILWITIAIDHLSEKEHLWAGFAAAMAGLALYSVITTRNEKRELHDLLFPDES